MANKTRDKGSGSIYQRPSGSWAATIELPRGSGGKRRRKAIYGKTQRAVLAELRKQQGQLEKSGDLPTSSMAVETWMTYWLDKILAPEVSPNTLKGHRSVATNHIIPNIGPTRIDKLTADHIRNMFGTMQQTPKLKKHRVEGYVPKEDEEIQMISDAYCGTAFDTSRAHRGRQQQPIKPQSHRSRVAPPGGRDRATGAHGRAGHRVP